MLLSSNILQVLFVCSLIIILVFGSITLLEKRKGALSKSEGDLLPPNGLLLQTESNLAISGFKFIHKTSLSPAKLLSGCRGAQCSVVAGVGRNRGQYEMVQRKYSASTWKKFFLSGIFRWKEMINLKVLEGGDLNL